MEFPFSAHNISTYATMNVRNSHNILHIHQIKNSFMKLYNTIPLEKIEKGIYFKFAENGIVGPIDVLFNSLPSLGQQLAFW